MAMCGETSVPALSVESLHFEYANRLGGSELAALIEDDAPAVRQELGKGHTA